MARLLIHVEGETEEEFVNEVLRGHLISEGYHSVEARIVGNTRLRKQRGGIRPWPSVRIEIVNHLLEDRGCIATTMVDYYGLPQSESAGWPGRTQCATAATAVEKGQIIHEAMRADLATETGLDISRFVPFVVMHEFEGLLFSDCGAFSRGIYRPDLERKFREIRGQFATPEEINDSPDTAPSKRLRELLPGYQKPLLGVLASLAIGLTGIRAECPHFDSWLRTLESRVI